jgi:Fe-S cluster biogenesis protein NfuA
VSDDFAALAARLDELMDRVRHADPAVRTLVDEVVQAAEEFTRVGLVALVQRLRADPGGEDLLVAALEQPEVMALLVRHRIVRGGRPLEVLQVVESLRPYLVASGADIEVVELDDERAVLRLTGTDATTGTELADGVEQTLLSRVPGLAEVSWVAAPTAPQAFVPVQDLLRRP